MGQVSQDARKGNGRTYAHEEDTGGLTRFSSPVSHLLPLPRPFQDHTCIIHFLSRPLPPVHLSGTYHSSFCAPQHFTLHTQHRSPEPEEVKGWLRGRERDRSVHKRDRVSAKTKKRDNENTISTTCWHPIAASNGRGIKSSNVFCLLFYIDSGTLSLWGKEGTGRGSAER
eukprot:Hpha_TRINITY_DN16770_c0_g1::TRINITY_DN16770_c0_g1_i3::g.77331::m.77331